MNQLNVAKKNTILVLAGRGWSHRRIARELGIHRDTVNRYVRLESKPAISTAGSEPELDPKPAIPTAGSAGRTSLCEPYREVIKQKLEQGLSAQRIWQDLRETYDFSGSYESAKRFVRRVGQANKLPFRRMEVSPGEEAQIDFGKGAWVGSENGKKKRPHLLRVVLGHSRKGYTEVVWRQTTENFLRAIENSFWHFGGVPRTLVIDNLRAAVTTPDWFDPELNPKVESFCQHYGTVILPTRVYSPWLKGKVESGVNYAQENAIKGRRFDTLVEQNAHLLEWETNVADTRIHGTTRTQVRKLFEEVERAALQPLPGNRFPMFHEGQRRVHRDGHVEVDKAYYSVPPEHVGRTVWVRWDGRLVRIFTARMDPITVHSQHDPGRFSTQDAHIAPRKRSMVERGASELLQRAGRIGPETRRWGESTLEVRGVVGLRVLVGLLSLAKKHRAVEIEGVCEVARQHGAFRLRNLRELLKRRKQEQNLELIQEHPIIRELAEYGALVGAKGECN